MSLIEVVDGPDWFSNTRRRQITNGRNDIMQRLCQVRLEITAANDAFFGLHIDEDQRPLVEQSDFGNNGPPERHNNGSHAHRLECEFFENHAIPPQVRYGWLTSGRGAGDVNSLSSIHTV